MVRTEPRARTLPSSPVDERPALRSRATGLRCVGGGHAVPLDGGVACPVCLSPLVVEYDLHGLRREGYDPRAGAAGAATGLARYAELLPPVEAPEVAYALEASPLRPVPRLARELGLGALYLKDDTVLPSGSFKDRGATLATAQARRAGYRAIGCASTGNLAAATARAAARAELPAVVIVPKGLSSAKLAPVHRYGARVVEVDGTYDAANRIAQVLSDDGRVAFLNVTLRPYYAEAAKSLLYESLDALDGVRPDAIGIPLGSGALLAATGRASEEARALGWLSPYAPGPALLGSQPEGCAPIVRAFEAGTDEVEPVARPDTVAESLAIGDPASAPEALRAIRASRGHADAPTREETLGGVRDLLRYAGVWSEPAGGSVIASLRRLRAAGTLRADDVVVAYITGAGWKGAETGPTPPAPISVPTNLPDPEALYAALDPGTFGGRGPW